MKQKTKDLLINYCFGLFLFLCIGTIAFLLCQLDINFDERKALQEKAKKDSLYAPHYYKRIQESSKLLKRK